jgi:hypothetical protein
MMMLYAGKYIRHGAAIIAAALFVWLLDKLPFLTTIAQPEQLMAAEEVVIGFITFVGMVIFGFVYAMVEKLLKNVVGLDPAGAAGKEVAEAEAVSKGYAR